MWGNICSRFGFLETSVFAYLSPKYSQAYFMFWCSIFFLMDKLSQTAVSKVENEPWTSGNLKCLGFGLVGLGSGSVPICGPFLYVIPSLSLPFLSISYSFKKFLALNTQREFVMMDTSEDAAGLQRKHHLGAEEDRRYWKNTAWCCLTMKWESPKRTLWTDETLIIEKCFDFTFTWWVDWSSSGDDWSATLNSVAGVGLLRRICKQRHTHKHEEQP